MKKLLIVTYYWPPAAGTGTQRCLKFARHLPDFGWEPVVFTSAERSRLMKDDSLEEELPQGIPVLSVAGWEPYALYRFFTGKTKTQAATPHLGEQNRSGIRERFSKWIRDNYFLPDARRFWIRPSVRFLSKYISENKIDALLTSGPPHSAHMIGLALKKRFPQLKWIADFRDPWMHIAAYHDASLTTTAAKKQAALERSVLERADEICTVSEPIRQSLAQKVQRDPGKFHTITNSFEPSIYPAAEKQTGKFILTHAGTLYRNRSPQLLWEAIAELTGENEKFRDRFVLNLVGKTEAAVLAQINAAGLAPYLRETGFVSHRQALAEMVSSDLLLVLVNQVPGAEGILTGKFFEYLGTGKPVLAIGKTGSDLAKIIAETNGGFCTGFAEKEKMKDAIRKVFEGNFSAGNNRLENYTARSVTARLANLLNRG